MPTLTIRDESLTGDEQNRRTLEFPTESISVRELIRERVYQEVEDYNRGHRTGGNRVFNGLVQPTESELALRGFVVKGGRDIDWKAQFEKACEAFLKNRVLVLVGEKQTSSLDEVIEIGRGVEVTFLRLVMLVGG